MSLKINKKAENSGEFKIGKKKQLLSNTNTSTSGSSGSIERFETMVMNISPLYAKDHDIYPACLVCLLGPEELIGRYWAIGNTKEVVIVGRSRTCDISIQELSLSKKHLIIRFDGIDKIFVKDQKSTNGTFINDKRIDACKEVELRDNSKVRMGNIVFKFLNKGNPEIVSVMESFEKAFYDSLTGVGNKLLFERRAKELFAQSKSYKTPLSFIIFDIDHFKKVNDTYGHLAGDFILKEVIQVSKSCFRSNDIITRCGGEEFCVIMQAEVNRARDVIEAVRKKIEGFVFSYKNQKIKVTISAGVACQQETDKGYKAIYERADQLLYKAKTTGRNKVFSSE
ncbi:MAG: GGDEF domain-containing protein [Bdellovibrionales bacterium]|nr:GGDEF domain-containing protein [Bdellovibrionales bacterium]